MIAIGPGFTREGLLACVDREIGLRRRVYPRWVDLGKISRKKADDEIATMVEVRAVLAQLPSAAPDQGDLFRGPR